MKKFALSVLLAVFCFVVSTPGYAHYEGYKANIKDGLAAMATSPAPVFKYVKEEYTAAKFKPFGVIGGFFKGGYYAVKQFGTGILKVVTFNFEEDNMFANSVKSE